jgi:hypothetical protein
MWETILTLEAFWGTVAVVLTLLSGLVLKQLRKVGLEKEAIDSLRSGVAQAQEKLVTFAKRAAADGKLSADERQQARDLAIQEAIELAKGPVRDVLTEWTKSKLEALVGRIVRGNQASGQAGN